MAAVIGLAVAPAAFAQQPRQERSKTPKQAPAAQPQPAAKPAPAPASTPEASARQAIIVDFQTDAVLFEKNADEQMPPSSMSKIMTGYLVFKALKEGRLSLTDKLPVSEKAWRIQGSKMFVAINSQVSVEDLLRGMIIQSGNDACIVLAEGLAGSEAAFADQMNEEGRRMGLTGSNFRNSTGWPDPEHYTTARDLAILAKRLIADFPEYYKYYSEITFTYGTDEKGTPIRQGNRNPLLYKSLGADGVKTGHTDAAGYGLTASAVRDGRRIVMVLNGMQSIKVRGEESERLLEWAYREFNNYALFKAGQPVDRADVWLGDQTTVQLIPVNDLTVTLPRRARPQMKVTVAYDSPVPAPIAKGAALGKVVVTAPGIETIELPLVAQEPVNRLGFAGRIGAAVSYLLWGSGEK
ncbi:MAG: D-alanyl-D-alanine carboxypeptidase [Rhodospirillales bacterium]|nr:D-alanyl-D-alanine carboxypeptidase [Rhodospirillales bacterium]